VRQRELTRSEDDPVLPLGSKSFIDRFGSLGWREHPERRVASRRVVEDLDVVEDLAAELLPCWAGPAMNGGNECRRGDPGVVTPGANSSV
jgi:hypothetical protein